MGERDTDYAGEVIFVFVYRRGFLPDDTIVCRVGDVFGDDVRVYVISHLSVSTSGQGSIVFQIRLDI